VLSVEATLCHRDFSFTLVKEFTSQYRLSDSASRSPQRPAVTTSNQSTLTSYFSKFSGLDK